VFGALNAKNASKATYGFFATRYSQVLQVVPNKENALPDRQSPDCAVAVRAAGFRLGWEGLSPLKVKRDG
jgi:hypothetical protein